jgi:hypothetical protein
VRSDDELLGATAVHVQDKFGIRPRIEDIDKNRTAAARERMKLSAASRGMPLEGYEQEQLPSRMPNQNSYAGEPVTPHQVARSTLNAFGHGVTDEADLTRMTNRRMRSPKMRESRTAPNTKSRR